MNKPITVWWQYLIAKRFLSRLAGLLADTQRFPALRLKVLQWYVRHYQVDMRLALREDLRDYRSFNDFFTRHLKPEARPFTTLPNSLLMPVDGAISEFGEILEQGILQAKGCYYSVESLLANDEALAKHFAGGQFITLYLAPKDYHRIHLPIDGQLQKMIYVPGTFFSVNPKTVNAVPALFARNERLICVFETAIGTMVVILVGALIVGSMSTVWAGKIAPQKQGIQSWSYTDKRISFSRGDEIGAFHLGSTVIVLFEPKKMRFSPDLSLNQTVHLGESLGFMV